MMIKPDFDVDKWCVYNERKFRLELKPEAPKEIKEKFKKWNKQYDSWMKLDEDTRK